MQYITLNKLQAGSEVNMSLQALFADVNEHELALLLFGTVRSCSPGDQELFGSHA